MKCSNKGAEQALLRRITVSLRETNTPLLESASKFWAGQVENRPGWLAFYTEYIKDIWFQTSDPKI